MELERSLTGLDIVDETELYKQHIPGTPITPPTRGSVVQCGHDFVYLYSEYKMIEGAHLNNYKQEDTFHCTKCLEYKIKLAKQTDERVSPTWYKGWGHTIPRG